MNAFTLTLMDGTRVEDVADVTSLVAADASGQFGIQAGHAPFVTVLEPGLFRYRRLAAPGWTHAAGLGGLLRCEREPGAGSGGPRTRVRLVSGRFLSGGDPQALVERLDALLAHEGALRISTRESRARVEMALLRTLQQLGRTESP